MELKGGGACKIERETEKIGGPAPVVYLKRDHSIMKHSSCCCCCRNTTHEHLFLMLFIFIRYFNLKLWWFLISNVTVGVLFNDEKGKIRKTFLMEWQVKKHHNTIYHKTTYCLIYVTYYMLYVQEKFFLFLLPQHRAITRT